MEDFVSFEIAKKLKEKGYPQHIAEDAYIIDNYGEEKYNIGDRLPIQYVPDYMADVAAPTISQVLKWLREEKEFMVFPVYSTNTSRWYCSIVNADSLDTYKLSLSDSYEEAALAGIEYVLDNLI